MSIAAKNLVPLFQVFDMPAALAFYQDLLNFEVLKASPHVTTPEGAFSHWVWLRNGEADLMLNTAYDSGERPPQEDPARRRAHGDVCLYIGCADVDEVYAALRGKALDVPPPYDTPHGARQLDLRDPDGYGVCFQSPL